VTAVVFLLTIAALLEGVALVFLGLALRNTNRAIAHTLAALDILGDATERHVNDPHAHQETL
jgi:hypothetical protein